MTSTGLAQLVGSARAHAGCGGRCRVRVRVRVAGGRERKDCATTGNVGRGQDAGRLAVLAAPAGDDLPRVVNAYIELTPFDTVKYEGDKSTGYLRVDRPHRGSAQSPTLYGFIPRTYSASQVAALSPSATAGADGDPLDICVISERPITRTEIVLSARVVGGIQMIDGGEADDKIVAVLHNDPYFDATEDLSDLPKALVDRMVHYFSTYKLMPGAIDSVNVAGVYGRAHAWRVIQAATADYLELYDAAPPSLQF